MFVAWIERLKQSYSKNLNLKIFGEAFLSQEDGSVQLYCTTSYENYNQTDQKHQNRDAVDAVHHTDIKIAWVTGVVGVMLSEYTNEVRKNFTYLEIFFDTGHNQGLFLIFIQ
jgi:hypothetical protein